MNTLCVRFSPAPGSEFTEIVANHKRSQSQIPSNQIRRLCSVEVPHGIPFALLRKPGGCELPLPSAVKKQTVRSNCVHVVTVFVNRTTANVKSRRANLIATTANMLS